MQRAAAHVAQRLKVVNHTRSYLIPRSFTAASLEKAAAVANAFALEFVRARTMQSMGDAVTAASRELARQSAIYGEKHPSIVQAKTELEAARMRFKAALNEPELAARKIAPGDAITLGEPNPTPSSPKGLVIFGLAFLLALISGIGLAVWFDRRKAERHAEDSLFAHTGGNLK